MNILSFITRAFIDFFGITPPDKAGQRRAMFYICGLLLLIVLLFAGFFVFMQIRTH